MATPKKDLKQDGLFVITANRFADGRVVWFTEQGYWSILIEEAKIFPNNIDANNGHQHSLQDVAAQYIIDPYVIELDTTKTPRTVREKIRACGPSTHPEFNPRSVQEIITNE